MKKKRIFSGAAPSRRESLSVQLTLLNMRLRRAGFPPVRPGGSGIKQFEAAINRAQEKLEEYQRPPAPPQTEPDEPPQPQREPEPEEPEGPEEPEESEVHEETRREKYERIIAGAGGLSGSFNEYSVLMSMLTPEEQEQLRQYDSDDILGIGEIWLDNDGMSVQDAINQYLVQQSQTFEDIENGDYDVNWDGVPFF